MTHVYFVRHAESDNSVHDDATRPLTPKGMHDRTLITDYLADKGVDMIVSSPYRRTRDTVAELAERQNLDIIPMDKLRERRIADTWIADFTGYAKQQWTDFDYKLPGGENLREVQARNIEALHELLTAYPGRTIAVGTHGTALSTIINYYDNTFTYENFAHIARLMPWIVHFAFDDTQCLFIRAVNPFTL